MTHTRPWHVLSKFLQYLQQYLYYINSEIKNTNCLCTEISLNTLHLRLGLAPFWQCWVRKIEKERVREGGNGATFLT